MSLRQQIDTASIPKHIAIIMDGNGRWAKSKGKYRLFGHQSAINAVREAAEGCAELGVKCLTLYAFSTENWNRPKLEVTALMELLMKTIKAELPTLNKNRIRLRSIGNTEDLPSRCKNALLAGIEQTAANDHMDLVLALSYGARQDMVSAIKKIALDVTNGRLNPSDINDKAVTNYLSTHPWPHPELLIRTSGEHRVSNFLLWEIAYSEFFFTPLLWPDFTRETLYEAILSYQNRERRFGKTSEQLLQEN